jgi:hypothetical protein
MCRLECQAEFSIASLADCPYPHLSVFLSRAKYQFSDLRCTKCVAVSFRSFPFRSVTNPILDAASCGRVPSHAGLLMALTQPTCLMQPQLVVLPLRRTATILITSLPQSHLHNQVRAVPTRFPVSRIAVNLPNRSPVMFKRIAIVILYSF